MNAIRNLASKYASKVLLVSAMLGGLAFFGASSASARPVYVAVRPRSVVVVHGYHGPRPVYVAPRVVVAPYGTYAVRPHYRPYRYWDARYHCWRYR